MSGKQHKREAKRAREAAREAERRRERRRTIQTGAVIALAVLIGGFIIYLSVPREPAPDEPLETDVAACEPAPPPEAAANIPKPNFPDGPEQVLTDGADYRAVVETTCGRIVFDLLEQEAPQTVNSFVFLARQGFFDGLEIFRNATTISALQTGAGDNQNTWSVGYNVPDEFAAAEAAGGYQAGDLAMANSGTPDSGGSQFFMVYGETSLPPQYTLFGRATEGLEVLRSIGAIPVQDPADPSNETPSVAVHIVSVVVEEGGAEGAADTAPTQE